MTQEQRQARARLAARARHHRDDPEVAAELRDSAARKLEDHVRMVVDQAPPLTVAQRERIAGLLQPPPASETA